MLLEDHTKRGNPGQFQIKEIEGLDSVVPVHGSILDTRITILDKQRTFGEALREVLQTLSRAINVRVSGPAISQPNLQPFNFSAENEPAREVLMRLFKNRNDRQFSWHLLYAPSWGYAFNLNSQPKQRETPKPTPSQAKELREITLPDGSKRKLLVNAPRSQ
jgi:hypothetical protein